VNGRKLWVLLLLVLLMGGGVGAMVAILAPHRYVQLPQPSQPPPLEFFFNESKPVVFDYLQFLDADGNPVLLLDFNQSVAEYLGDGWGEPEYWGGDEGWVCTAYKNCSLNINPPKDAHFIRLRAACAPVNPYTEWKQLLRNAIRIGVRVNGTITDDGLHVNGTDLTKCISNRFWICYYILKPDADSDKDGIPNCIKIAEKHYRALDLNPRIPEPKPIKTRDNITVIATYVPIWGHHFMKLPDVSPEIKPVVSQIKSLRKDGWTYDNCDPDVWGWHIKQAVEHGIKAFSLTWGNPYWCDGFNLEGGLLRSPYVKYIKFMLMFNFEPYVWKDRFHVGETAGNAAGIITSYAIRNLFDHPSYLRVEDKPAVFLFLAEAIRYSFKDDYYAIIEAIRGNSTKLNRPIYLIGDVMVVWHGGYANEIVKDFDAITGWLISDAGAGNYWHINEDGKRELIAPYSLMVSGYADEHAYWLRVAKRHHVDFIPTMTRGYDNINLYKLGFHDFLCRRTDATPEQFREMIRLVMPYIDPNLKLIICCSWNEYGENSHIEPTLNYGYTYLNIIKEMFGES